MPGPVLLVVNDDAREREIMERDLQKAYGERYTVRGAPSGAAALEALRRCARDGEPVALVIADQQMPGMTGIACLEQARALAPHAKRVLLTTLTEAHAVIRA